MEKNFIENLDKIKKLLNLWSSRGLALHGKVTVIKSLVIPKFVYVSSLIPTPREVVKNLNRMLFNFLWKGKDKVTRLSVINEYEKGGLKMVDLEALIQSLRLAWIKRIFSRNGGTWKNYLLHLDHLGGLFFFSCNYDMNDYSIPCQFYLELLQWWSDFRETFASCKDWSSIIWNNKEIRVNKLPVFYKNYIRSGIVSVGDLHFDLSNVESFDIMKAKINRTNFLVWTGLSHSVPHFLKSRKGPPMFDTPSFTIDGNLFNVMEKNQKVII